MVDKIASWPMHVTKRVGPLNFGISHNLPWLNMGQDLFPTQASENFDKLFNVAGEPVDVAIYAHVHHDLLRYGSDERMVIEVKREERITLRVANPHRKRQNQEFLRMFEMGYSTKGENRGVGLYQVKKLAQKYKCELVAENRIMDEKNYVCFTLKI